MRNAWPILLALIATVHAVGCSPDEGDTAIAKSPLPQTPAVQQNAQYDAPETTQPRTVIEPNITTPTPVTGQQPPDTTGSTADDKQPPPAIDELFLFFPSKYPEGDWRETETAFEDVWFSSADGVRLHGWYCPHKQPQAVVLFAHGNAGNLSHRRQLLLQLRKELSATLLIFDYRGYGRSDGSPTVEGILQDARAARSFLAERATVKESALVLMGRSLGGAVMVQLAAETRPRGLILESTFSSLKEVARAHYPKLAWLVRPDKLNSADRIAHFHGPLFQSHGDADEVIPFTLGQRLYKAANEPKQFLRLRGGRHNNPRPIEYFRRLSQFVKSLPEPPPNASTIRK